MYKKRIADKLLKNLLDASGAVLIEGPKWCGKTTTAQQAAASYIKLQDTRMRAQYLATAEANPALLLYGKTPRLIDEWQDAPILWDTVRTMVDERAAEGQFILTGSNTVDKSICWYDSVAVWEKDLMGMTEDVATGKKAGYPWFLTGGEAIYPLYYNNPNFAIEGESTDGGFANSSSLALINSSN